MILPTSLKYSDNSLYIIYSKINIEELNKNKYYENCLHEETNITTNDSKIDSYPAFFEKSVILSGVLWAEIIFVIKGIFKVNKVSSENFIVSQSLWLPIIKATNGMIFSLSIISL